MRRVLVTGASGFIGRHCIAPLAARGWEIHAFTSKAPPPDFPAVTWHRVDLHEMAQVAALVDDIAASHLLHLAWSFGPGGSDSAAKGACPDHYRWTLATLQLIRRFREAGGKRAVSAGTSFEYDWSNGLCSEFDTLRRPSSYYGTCKTALFELLSGYADTVGLSLAWPRIFFLYGPHEPRARLVSSVIGNLLRGEPALSTLGTQLRDYLYVGDVAEALVAILDSDVRGPVNIGSQKPVALRDIIHEAADQIGQRQLVRLGALPMRPGDAPLVVADTTRLRTEVGWEPRFGLAEGLALTIAWWRQQLDAEAALALQHSAPKASTT